MSTTNPEDAVLDAIAALEWSAQDELIESSLRQGPDFDDYCRDWHDRSGDLRCSLCAGQWHGLDNGDCPGAFATDEQKRAYEEHHRDRRPRHFKVSSRILVPPPLPPRSRLEGGLREPVTLASPEMAQQLQEHVRRYPEDEATLRQRYQSVLFAADGQPLPYTRGGLVAVLSEPGRPPEWHVVEWASREIGLVPSEEPIAEE